MIGLFGIVPEPSHSLEDLIQLWRRPGFIIYFSMIEFAVISLLVFSTIVEQVLKQDSKANLANHRHARYRSGSIATASVLSTERTRGHHGHDNNYGSGLSSSSSSSSSSLSSTWAHCSKVINGRLQQRNLTPARIKTMLGICYGCVSGLLSSQTLLIAKSAIELLMLTVLEGNNQFENPLSWFLVVALLSAALLQLYYLNKGLELCDTVLLVPLSFCAYNVSCLFNGLVYYNQWGRLYWWQILLVLFGISQVLIGVLVLAWRPNPEEEFDDTLASDEATLLLPNASQPSTPRHSRVFSFKGINTDTPLPSPGLVAGHHSLHHQLSQRQLRQDPSIDAMNLIHGFEMYDSEEDDARTNVADQSPLLQHQQRQRQQQPRREQEEELITLVSDDHRGENYLSTSAQSLRELSLSPPRRAS